MHKSRARKYNFEPGDLVYVFRERRPTVKGKRAQKQWLGPCTVVGTEGQNFWVSKRGRCLLCAPEHLRPAEASKISELLKIKAAMGDIQALIEEDKKLDVGFAPGEVEEDNKKENPEHPLLELFDENTAGKDLEGEFVQLENMDWEEVAERRRKCLDDVPTLQRQRQAQQVPMERPEAKEIWLGKVAATVASRQKRLETEIP